MASPTKLRRSNRLRGKQIDRTMASTELVALPEECIFQVLSLTSPKDVCCSSATSHFLKSAADSDEVWEEFLPKGYRNLLLPKLVPRGDDPPFFNFPTKRDLYFRLCEPTHFDGGSQSFVLERSTGKTCFMISGRYLSIFSGFKPECWQWISLPHSRFSVVTELIEVCRLTIDCYISSKVSKLFSPKTTYVACLVFKLRRSHYGLGWPSQSASITVGGNKLSTEIVSVLYHNQDADQEQDIREIPRARRNFRPGSGEDRRHQASPNAKYTPHSRVDGWMETVLGEFFIDDEDGVGIWISFKGNNERGWKSGLIVEGIEIRPKNQ